MSNANEINILIEEIEASKKVVKELHEALQNASGFLDTPISRRRHGGNPLFEEMIDTMRSILDKTKENCDE